MQYTEIWAPVPVEPYNSTYEVSNFGNVRNSSTKKLRKPRYSPNGYVNYTLWHNYQQKTFLAHRLVALAFIPKSVGLDIINHKDGDRGNNHVSNLEWSDKSANAKHAYRQLGVKPTHGESIGSAKLTPDDIREIRRLYSTGQYSTYKIAELYPVNAAQIHAIVSYKYWKHIS